MSEPLVELPDEVCFNRSELGELLNLLDWLRELLRTADDADGAARVEEFIRLTQRRLWGDVQDIIDEEDNPEEG